MNPLAAVLVAIPLNVVMVIISGLLMRPIKPRRVSTGIIVDEAAILVFVGLPMTWFAYATGNAAIGLETIIMTWVGLVLAAALILLWKYSAAPRDVRHKAYRNINCAIWFLAMCITYLPSVKS